MTTTATPAPASENSVDGARNWFADRGIVRSRDGRWIGGVSAGLARRYEVNPLVTRLSVLMSVLLLTPLIYIALWVLMPLES
jgi:phage shock protein PspC (stress-responsive transcriptional regulator)